MQGRRHVPPGNREPWKQRLFLSSAPNKHRCRIFPHASCPVEVTEARLASPGCPCHLCLTGSCTHSKS